MNELGRGSDLDVSRRASLDLLEKMPSLTVKVARTLAERVGANELSDLKHGS